DFELRSAKASLESLGTEEQATLVDKVGGFACLVLALGHGGSRVKDRKDAEYIPERDHLRYRNWEAGLKLHGVIVGRSYLSRFQISAAQGLRVRKIGPGPMEQYSKRLSNSGLHRTRPKE
ncbi:hypothetical protein FRC18_004614, partial [Serendipita sp. 400]